MNWDASSLYVRYGAFSRLTFTAEGGLWSIDETVTTYQRWVLGGGLTGLLYTRGRWAIDADFTYNEVYDHDESVQTTDHRTYGWNTGVLARGSFTVKDQRVDLYAGPMYVIDVAESYPFNTQDPVRSEPDQHWGACTGMYATLFDYVSGFAYVLFLDEPQFRFGVSLRSRGEQP
jgi:hypothetical protein